MSVNIVYLFDDEDGVVDQLPLEHRVDDIEELTQMTLAVPEGHDDGQTLSSDASFW